MAKYTGTILDSGLGSKDRRAALVAAFAATLADTHGNSAESRVLLGILADAETRLSARLARKAERAADRADAEPTDEPTDEPVKAEPVKARKATGKHKPVKAPKSSGKAEKARKSAGSVPCMACFGQVAFADAIAYPDGYVCPRCEKESQE